MSASKLTVPDLDGTGVTSRFIDVAGVRTHYLEAGEGAPLVLVHGGGAGADAYGNWLECIQVFAKSYRVIAPDMIGFGYTDKPSPDVYRYDQPGRNKHLADFLEAMGLSGVALVGNSMGGAASIGVAIDKPELVGQLVLMGSAGLPIPEKPSAHLLHNLQYDFTVEGMRRVVGGLTGPDFKPSDAMIQYRYDLCEDPEIKAALQAINALTRTGTLNYPEDEVRKIKHPTLVVNGKQDGVSILPRAYRFLELLDNSWGYIVPHCGHWAMIERQDDFCAAVEGFLARTKA
jgi:2-hydroxy-6-oxo-6-(2'-aminophenyl)hexa-2,4-dienoate hydrolase